MKFLWGILILQGFTAGSLIRSESSEYRVWDNNEIDKSNGRSRQLPGWPIGVLGQSNPGASNTDDVTFFYYPANKYGVRELTIETDHLHGLGRANLSQHIPYKFIIPGFFESCESSFAKRMVAAYRLRMDKHPMEEYQIICVDWRGLSGIMRTEKVIDYLKLCAALEAEALRNAPKIADLTVKFIRFLMAQHKIRSIKDIHIIGFGVGCHMAGHIGHALRKLNTENEYIGRITALDPSKLSYSPLSIFSNKLKKLESNDAFYVDVYHTDVNKYGTTEILGDVDFFPNGGGAEAKYQPEYKCVKLDIELFKELPLIGGLLDRIVNLDIVKNNIYCRGQYTSEAICNHNLAYIFFAMSIVDDQIAAYECQNYDDLVNNICKKSEVKRATFGEFVLRDAGYKMPAGKYYLKLTPQRNYRGLVFYGEIEP